MQLISERRKKEIEDAIRILNREKAIISDKNKWAVDLAIKALKWSPVLLEDGTLVIESELYDGAKRVLLCHKEKGSFFYVDEDY